jgi:hypothetical protein
MMEITKGDASISHQKAHDDKVVKRKKVGG